MTPKTNSNAAQAASEPLTTPLAYVVDPADYKTEESYIDGIETKLARALNYDQWEQARSQWSKEWRP